MKATPFVIGGETIEPGTTQTLKIPLSFLSDHTRMHLTVHVIHGRTKGPVTFISAAIHGDEIIGVEIIRRLCKMKNLSRLKGTLILVPVVNTYGFNGLSRYLPDRRDLNRSFPGSEQGSLASQLAYIFMTEIVEPCDYGIDLHSGAVHRANLPQIRACMDNPVVKDMATAFGTSIMLNSNLRDGSLREAAQAVGCQMLLYEAGEALRFDESAIRIGVRGALSVMRHIGMLPKSTTKSSKVEPVLAKSSHWLRASMGGILRAQKQLGDSVKKGEVIGKVSDPLGQSTQDVLAKSPGIVIGRTNLPVVNRGDALYHIALVDSVNDAEDVLSSVEMDAERDPLFDRESVV